MSCGKKWCDISRILPGRNEHSVKNRYFSLLRQEKKRLKKVFMSEGKNKRRKKGSYNSNRYSEAELLKSLLVVKKEEKGLNDNSRMEESPAFNPHQLSMIKEEPQLNSEIPGNQFANPTISMESSMNIPNISLNMISKPTISMNSVSNNLNPMSGHINPMTGSINPAMNTTNSMNYPLNNLVSSSNTLNTSSLNTLNGGSPPHHSNFHNQNNNLSNNMNNGINNPLNAPLNTSFNPMPNPPMNNPMNNHLNNQLGGAMNNLNINSINNNRSNPYDMRSENNMFLNNFYNFMPTFLPFSMINNPFSSPFFPPPPSTAFPESFNNFNQQNPFHKLSDSLDKLNLKPSKEKKSRYEEDLKIISLSHLDNDNLNSIGIDTLKEHNLTPTGCENFEGETPNFLCDNNKASNFKTQAMKADILHLKVKNFADLSPREKNSKSLKLALINLEKNEVYYLNQNNNVNPNSDSSNKSGSYVSINNSNTSNSLNSQSAKLDINESMENLNTLDVKQETQKRSKFGKFVNNE